MRMAEIERKIGERIYIIELLVDKLSEAYLHRKTTKYQKDHIETIIGAALWYIPNTLLWTGYISKKAIQTYHPKEGLKTPKLTKDHFYPRKISAQKLLKQTWQDIPDKFNFIYNLYVNEIGKYHYVTPDENKRLVKYQKSGTYESPIKAYESANIVLIKITQQDLKSIKNRKLVAINKILQNHP